MNKVEKIKKLADAMYNSMQNLTTDTSGIRKAMDKYHQFIINEYYKEDTKKDFSIKESVIPFDASDSELIETTYFIPQGFNAIIDGDKIIFTRKESEDEKIRKTLIDYFNTYNGDYYGELKRDSILAWLEKQGKQKTICNEEDKKIIKTYDKDKKASDENIKACIGMCLTDINEQRFKDYNTNLRDCLAWLEKQGEQKHIDYNEELKKCRENPLYFIDKYIKFKEQKSTWNEDDMSKIQRICKYLNEAKKYYADITEVRECIDWLTLLKDRVTQSKQEWYEEDDNDAWMNDIISKVENNLQLNKAEIDWLKSLKQRYTWKPSDEQMEALEQFISEYKDIDDSNRAYPISHIIESLYNDLKKLKGD